MGGSGGGNGGEKRGWGGVRDNLVGKALKRFTGRFLVVLQHLCPGFVGFIVVIFVIVIL